MKGDFTRSTFQEKKHYHGVYTQQGRVRLDADSNEQVDIQLHLARSSAADLVGPAGIPRTQPGFRVAPTPDGTDISIPAGHIYVDGILCENETDITYRSQPDYPNPDPAVKLIKGHNYLVYLDVWTLGITALEDPGIREKALGGPDTAVRGKTVWQVKLAPVDWDPAKLAPAGWDPALLETTGRMSARTTGPKAAAECRVDSASGYSGLENQLYRVEIHRGSPDGKPTLKWSRDNGAVTASIVSQVGDTFTVKQLGPDQALGFANEQWVELLNDDLELHGRPGFLGQVAKPDPAACTLSINPAPPAGTAYTKMRRWDQTGADAGAQGIDITYDWQPIECGLEVRFSKGRYSTGDYWLIPARTAIRDILWDANPADHPNDGIKHHYCQLAVVACDGVKFAPLTKPHPTFPPLTAITAADVSFDDQNCASPSPLVGKQNVQDALAALATLSAADIPFVNTTAQLDNAKTVQDAIDCLSQREGCFTLTAQPGPNWQSVFARIPADTHNAHICLRPGEYTLENACLVDSGAAAPDVKGALRITGCGPAAHLTAACKAALVFRGWQSVHIEGVSVTAGGKTPFAGGKGITPEIWGALTFDDCAEVVLQQVTLRCAGGAANGAACLKVNNRAPANAQAITTSFRASESALYPGNRQIGMLIVNAGRTHIENNLLGASGSAVDFSAQLADPRYILDLRRDLVTNPTYSTIPPGAASSVSSHGREVRFTTPPELARAWQKLLDAKQLKPGVGGRDMRVAVTALPAQVLKSLRTDASVPKELAPFQAWLKKQDRTLLDGLQKGQADAIAKLCGMMMTRVEIAPARKLGTGRAQATVMYQQPGGKTFTICFETANGLQTEWQNLLVAEKPQIASARDLLKYVYARAGELVAGNAALTQRKPFADWRGRLARNFTPVSSQAIVVAGSHARDVRILNNTIEATHQAIHVALSHTRRIETPRKPRALPDGIQRLVVGGNTIWLLVTPAALAERCGVFVGNCESLVIENNYVDVRREPNNTLAVAGVKLFGHFGGLVVVRQNHIANCMPEFHMTPLPGATTPHQWLVCDNYPPSAKL